MTSSNGNIFRVAASLWGHGWFPLTKASDAELWCFLWSAGLSDSYSPTPRTSQCNCRTSADQAVRLSEDKCTICSILLPPDCTSHPQPLTKSWPSLETSRCPGRDWQHWSQISDSLGQCKVNASLLVRSWPYYTLVVRSRHPVMQI